MVRTRQPNSSPPRAGAPDGSPGVAPNLDLWRSVQPGWQPLLAPAPDAGFTVAWHDFHADAPFNCSAAFVPGQLYVLLNVAGTGEVRLGSGRLVLGDATVGYVVPGQQPVTGQREGSQRHQLALLAYSTLFLGSRVSAGAGSWRRELAELASGEIPVAGFLSEPMRLTGTLRHLAATLRQPQVGVSARRLWYEAKALEVAALVLFEAGADRELFCHRQKRTSQERVVRTIAILKEHLAEPPTLEELGRRVGCSPYYLSRVFSQEMGKTISAYLRDLRMERAAELLRGGRANVTEAALSVGYSSLSHFSATFRETFGCCPGLYPIPIPGGRKRPRGDKDGAGVQDQ